ncbi:MAG: hypothetical protein AMJ67_12545 [Betaproteobacteria bacterium SG8_41]|nr:MAG: hypothetical protein AMJ67_12545 [Betaproteobacteria bacterium SG8_41]
MVPAPALASDFSILIVGLIAFGISGVLLVQVLVAVVFLLNGRYKTKSPGLFVGFAAALVLIGAATVLSESSHLSSNDTLGLLAAVIVPGVIAISLPLLQRTMSKP